jgi:hypothetical protein
LIKKWNDIIYSFDTINIIDSIRSAMKKQWMKFDEISDKIKVYEKISYDVRLKWIEINTQYKNVNIIDDLWTYIYDRVKHVDRHTINTSKWSIQFENIWDNMWTVHAWVSSKILSGRAYNFLFDKLPVWSKIIEQVSLSWDSFTNLLKLYKKWWEVDCKVSFSWTVKLNIEWKYSNISNLITKESNQKWSIYSGKIEESQSLVDEINLQIK